MFTSRRSASILRCPLKGAALAFLLGLGVSCTEPPTEPPSAPETSVGPTHKGLSFRQVSAGGGHTCGVTTTNVAYCWGENYSGQLGDGTTTNRLIPTLVGGS